MNPLPLTRDAMSPEDIWKEAFAPVYDLIEDNLNLAQEIHRRIRNSENQPRYGDNLFEHFGTDEPVTSWAIRHILRYPGVGDKFPILRNFIDHFLSSELNSDDVQSPEIQCEKGKIDIAVYDRGYAIVVENKLKGAVFQRNQLARYLRQVQDDIGKETRLALVILPDYHREVPKSVWRLPADWQSPNDSRACAVPGDPTLCRCDLQDCLCKGCHDYAPQWADKAVEITATKLIEWLEQIEVPERETALKSHIQQFTDYLKIITQQDETHLLAMELAPYIRERLFTDADTPDVKLKKLNIQLQNLDELRWQIDSVRKAVCREAQQEHVLQVIREMKLPFDKPTLDLVTEGMDGPFSGFKTDKGLWLGLEHDPKNGGKIGHYYVAIHAHEGFTRETKELASDLANTTNIEDWEGYDHDRYLWRWDDTAPATDPVAMLRKLLQAALDLGYTLC